MRRCPSVYAQFGHTYDMYLSYTYKTAYMRFDLSMCGTNDLKLICSKLELQISYLLTLRTGFENNDFVFKYDEVY